MFQIYPIAWFFYPKLFTTPTLHFWFLISTLYTSHFVIARDSLKKRLGGPHFGIKSLLRVYTLQSISLRTFTFAGCVHMKDVSIKFKFQPCPSILRPVKAILSQILGFLTISFQVLKFTRVYNIIHHTH